MSDPDTTTRSQLWRGARQGAGFALGTGAVLSVAALLRAGPREAAKALIKGGMRAQEAMAEALEQGQDLLAEARHERSGPGT